MLRVAPVVAVFFCVTLGGVVRGQGEAGSDAACPRVDEDVNLAVFDFVQLQTMSGLVASSRSPRLFLTHNDNGEPRVHVVRDDGRWMGEIQIDGADRDDWEDLAADEQYVYVGDIGDDRAQREALQIYRFREPAIDGPGLPSPVHDPDLRPASAQVRAQRMDVRLDGGAVDARTLLVHEGALYVVSHEPERARVFAVGRFRPGRTVTARLAASVPLGEVTGGDVSVDGRVVLRTLDRAWLFRPREGALRFDSPCPVLLRAERRGEAIAFDRAGAHYFTVSEGRSALYRFRLPR